MRTINFHYLLRVLAAMCGAVLVPAALGLIVWAAYIAARVLTGN